MPQQNKPATTAILQAGFLAGSLDIATALLQFYFTTGKSPLKVLNFIASGLLGKDALAKGAFANEWWLPVLGLLLHFMIAFIFTLLFFGLYPKIKGLACYPIITGLIYGIIVWLVMNLLVVPLSNAPKFPFNAWKATQGLLILMLMVGLPISFIISSYYKRKSRRGIKPKEYHRAGLRH